MSKTESRRVPLAPIVAAFLAGIVFVTIVLAPNRAGTDDGGTARLIGHKTAVDPVPAEVETSSRTVDPNTVGAAIGGALGGAR